MALTFISCASAISRPLVTSIVAITRRLNSGEIVKWLRTTEWQSYCFANLDLFAANELIVFTELWPIFQHPCFGLIKRLSEKSQHAVGLYPRHTTVHRTTLLFFGLLRRAQGSCVGPGIPASGQVFFAARSGGSSRPENPTISASATFWRRLPLVDKWNFMESSMRYIWSPFLVMVASKSQVRIFELCAYS